MKRFTDSEKWVDPWFRQLTPTTKVFWLFLLDNCDNAGIWERDDAFFKFVSGIEIEIDAHLEDLADRIVVLDECRILVPKFVSFQQGGELKESKPFHRGIFKILEKHGLEQNGDGKICHGNAIPMPCPSHSNAMPMVKQSHSDAIPMASSIGNGIGNGKGNGLGKGKKGKESAWPIPEELNTPEFREAWNAYLAMRKENKWATLKPSSLKARFKEFKEHGIEKSIRALEDSVRQGWRGIFPGHHEIEHDDTDRNYDDPV